MKRQDLLEKLITSLAGDYPELTRTILEERDLYLARSIWEVCGLPPAPAPPTPEIQEEKVETEESGELRQRHRDGGDDVDRVDEEDTKQDVPSSPRLQCCHEWPSINMFPRVVVAVVGIGHVAGIKRVWDRASTINKSELMR